MQEFYCPICRKVHDNIPYTCECGYYEDKKRDYDDEKEYLFAIYKFSKMIFNKQIEWKQSKCRLAKSGESVTIQEIIENTVVSYVDLDIKEKQYVDYGVLAHNRRVESLIINADSLSHEMLDESDVQMLFLGEKVSDLTGFINVRLKYIEVSKNNKYFTAKNNVLFNKDMTRLIYYCSLKPDEEYTIPKSVEVVSDWAFINNNAYRDKLKVIHCSKKVKFEDSHCEPSPYKHIKIIYDQD